MNITKRQPVSVGEMITEEFLRAYGTDPGTVSRSDGSESKDCQ